MRGADDAGAIARYAGGDCPPSNYIGAWLCSSPRVEVGLHVQMRTRAGGPKTGNAGALADGEESGLCSLALGNFTYLWLK